MRLDKYLANNGYGSRSEVKKLIAAGMIRIDGTVVKDSGFNVKEGSVIDGLPDISHKVSTAHIYYMMNKPAGVITAASDAVCKTVMDLLSTDRKNGLNPVGRLDKDTEGLLIITDDGELNHFLTSPKRNVPKRYFAIMDGIPDEEGIQRLREGIRFKDFISRPAQLEIIDTDEASGTSRVYFTVTEGRFHEIKRLAAAIGCDVKYLKRTMFAGVKLDDGLKPGEYRIMTDEEAGRLRKAAYETSDKKQDGAREMLENVDAVIFDLDGTLVDSMWMWKEIDIEYLGGMGIEYPEDLHSCIDGMSFTETAVYFKERFNTPEDVDSIKDTWNEMARDMYAHRVGLKPGVAGFLEKLKNRGIKTGVASSNSMELVLTVLEALNIRKFFDEIHTSCEVEHGKPFPDIFLLVAERLGVAPGKCLVFEDIIPGIKAAHAANMKVCAVYDSFSEADDDQKREMADYYLTDYSNNPV